MPGNISRVRAGCGDEVSRAVVTSSAQGLAANGTDSAAARGSFDPDTVEAMAQLGYGGGWNMTPAKGCAARTPQAGGKSEIGPVGTTPPLVWAQHYRSNPSTGPSLVRFSPEMRLMHGAKTFDTPSIFRKRAAGGPSPPEDIGAAAAPPLATDEHMRHSLQHNGADRTGESDRGDGLYTPQSSAKRRALALVPEASLEGVARRMFVSPQGQGLDSALYGLGASSCGPDTPASDGLHASLSKEEGDGDPGIQTEVI